MAKLEREEMQRRARVKFARMKPRPARLRRRAFATAIVAFAVVWAVIFVQMVSGHDPALSPSAAAAGIEKRGGSEEALRKVKRIEAELLEGEHTELEAERIEAALFDVEPAVRERLEELEPVATRQS